MPTLRAALALILAGSATGAWAEQITCESRQDRTEACGTVAAGSSVTLSQQLSNTPCVEGQNWGTGPNRDSIWVSGGCRAVFDVQPPYDNTADRNNYDSGERVVRDDGERYQDSRDPRDARDQDQGFRDNAHDGDSQHSDSGYNDQNRRGEDRNEGSRYASVDRNRSIARRACVDQAASNQSYRRDDIRATDVQWIGQGMFSVNLDTPDGSMTCTVDRDGNVTALNSR